MPVRKLLYSETFAVDASNIADALEEAAKYIRQQQAKGDYTVVGLSLTYRLGEKDEIEFIITGEP